MGKSKRANRERNEEVQQDDGQGYYDVYDMFVARFEWLAKVITFDMFSMMVDEALEQMRTMLDSNEAVQKLIANEAGEGSE